MIIYHGTKDGKYGEDGSESLKSDVVQGSKETGL